MAQNQSGRRAGTKPRFALAWILAAGSLGAPAVAAQPPSQNTAANELALILDRLKADFANPESTYPHDVHGPGFPRGPGRGENWLATLEADGHWTDVSYTRPPWNTHLIRLVQMATAYANPSGPDYHSPRLLEGVVRGLRYWFDRNPLRSDNWWDNTVGAPQMLMRILVPMEDVLPGGLLRQGVSCLVPKSEVEPSYSRAAVSFPQQQLVRGALARSADDIASASAEMQRVIRIRTDEGIQRDLSFHQHGPQLYHGGYGITMLSDMCNYAMVLRGTRFAFEHGKLMLLADHLLAGSGRMIRGPMLDYSTFGRTLLRRDAGKAALEFKAICDQLAVLLPERAAALTALGRHIDGTGAPYSYLGNRYFWNSDFMTHQREAWYASVKMVSYRTVGTESFAGENLNGAWLPFGVTWIVRRGDEYNGILPVLDWGRLPGVTSPHVVVTPVRNISQPEWFVGGVSDGTYGAAAMAFAMTEPLPLVPKLRIATEGRKAWFLFDREMVALGAGIASTRDEPVGTTLNQTGLRGPVLVDGRAIEPGETKLPPASWVLHDEIGYMSLGPEAATLELASPKPVFTLWIDHGVHPHDARYAYAVVPGTDARRMAEWTAHPPVRILANTPAQQAVVNDQAGVAELVFHQPGTLAVNANTTVKVDHPCLVLLVNRKNSTRIAVSSPGGEFFSVRLTLTTAGNQRNLTFGLPSGDMAGKSQVMEVARNR
jgi:chondroitin AC lyase